MAVHAENFVSVRKLYPRVTERVSTRMAVADPASAEERDYRDLLSEANLNFFHREYSIALDNYKALRYKILVQSHPEMAKVPGSHGVIDFHSIAVDPNRLIEASRRVYVKTNPGGPVTINLKDDRIIKAGEVAANSDFAKFSALWDWTARAVVIPLKRRLTLTTVPISWGPAWEQSGQTVASAVPRNMSWALKRQRALLRQVNERALSATSQPNRV
jgi:hypothetical protein